MAFLQNINIGRIASDVDVSVARNDSNVALVLMRAMTPLLNNEFRKLAANVRKITRDLLRQYIQAQPEWEAIIGSSLRYELGLVDPLPNLLSILEHFVQSVRADFTPFKVNKFNVGFEGGIDIRAIRSDYIDIITLPESHFESEHGYDIPWLQWLLLEGDKTIIENYRVKFGNHGRTGGAIMVKGGSWHVPHEYSGDVNDNFITRAIAQMEPELKKVLDNELS